MLLGEDRGGHEHGDLFATHNRFESSADSNFGFSKADITTNQAVHRFWAFHVGFGFDNGAHLIGGFFEEKCAFKFALPGRVRIEGMASLGVTRGLNSEQFSGDIAHRHLCLCLGFGPACSTQGIERWSSFTGADIFANEVRLGHWHIEFWRRLGGIVGSVLDNQALLSGVRSGANGFGRFRAGPHRKHLQTGIPSDAMLQMNNVIPFFQIGEINIERRTGCLRVR